MTRPIEFPNFNVLKGVVSSEILQAARDVSAILTKKRIRHALIGGLAVAAYGYVRVTDDVDFLVGDEGFEQHGGGILTFAPGVPIRVGDVGIDMVSDALGEDIFEDDDLLETDGVPIVSPETLIYLKLKAHRRRDKEDVVELLKAGLEEAPIRAYLQDMAPELIKRFDALCALADEEE